MPDPLTRGSSRCRMSATLARVATACRARSWYNANCTQKPPHTYVQVTLARGTGPECGAACVLETREDPRGVRLVASHRAGLGSLGRVAP